MEAVCSSASAFLDPSAELRQACEDALVKTYSQVIECLPRAKFVVDRLHTVGLGSEDVWQQLELLNEVALKKIVRDARRRDKNSEERVPECPVTVEDIVKTSSREVEIQEEDVTEPSDGSDSETSAGSAPPKKDARRRAGVDDKFFKLAEMEDFVNQAEREHTKGALATRVFLIYAKICIVTMDTGHGNRI